MIKVKRLISNICRLKSITSKQKINRFRFSMKSSIYQSCLNHIHALRIEAIVFFLIDWVNFRLHFASSYHNNTLLRVLYHLLTLDEIRIYKFLNSMLLNLSIVFVEFFQRLCPSCTQFRIFNPYNVLFNLPKAFKHKFLPFGIICINIRCIFNKVVIKVIMRVSRRFKLNLFFFIIILNFTPSWISTFFSIFFCLSRFSTLNL